MEFKERFKLGLSNLKYKYSEWKSKAPEREEMRVIKELANIEKAKRIVAMEEQKAKLMKHKATISKHSSEIRKYSQQSNPKSQQDLFSMQPSGFSEPSYFIQSKTKKNERRI